MRWSAALGSVQEFWSLFVWWGVWSLADTYLLQYSPYPELLVVGACLAAAVVAEMARRKTQAAHVAGVAMSSPLHKNSEQAFDAV
jgi:ABC-type thiamin/hydroxymethylpyrimidine transport system permease subunit